MSHRPPVLVSSQQLASRTAYDTARRTVDAHTAAHRMVWDVDSVNENDRLEQRARLLFRATAVLGGGRF